MILLSGHARPEGPHPNPPKNQSHFQSQCNCPFNPVAQSLRKMPPISALHANCNALQSSWRAHGVLSIIAYIGLIIFSIKAISSSLK